MLVYLAMIPTEEGRNKFALLYWEYRDLMFYLALRILGSQQDAEDAVTALRPSMTPSFSASTGAERRSGGRLFMEQSSHPSFQFA